MKLITDKVTATDISEAMIAVCKNNFKEHNIQFYCAKAEDTCIPSEPYDIVTVAGVISWVDKRLFFNKMNEVMSDNGLLVIYDFWITNTMENNKMYKDWYDNHYLKEFPKPKRNEEEIIIEEFTKELMFEKKVIYKTVYEFALKEFVDFMMIQSNVNVTIEKGNKNIEDVSEWMYKTLKPIFEGEKRNLVFEGYSWYLKKTN